jgi:peptidoglycan/xylan/chitin deacetylase (PgdA/CDA1 family)
MTGRAALLAAGAAAVLAAGCGGGQGRDAATAPGAHATTAPRRQAADGPAHGAARKRVRVARSRQAVPVLMYHVIGTPAPGTPLPGLWVRPDAFRAEVRALAAAGFSGVTLDRVLDAWHGRATLPAHPIVFSFDDGYLGQGKVAAAVLRQRGWPGVLDLVLQNLGTPGGLTTGRIERMIAEGWEVDAHTLHHLDLTTLAPAALSREVAGSRDAIQRRFGVVADGFCYPAGRFDPAVESAVRAAGFRAAMTERPGAARPQDDPYALPRVRVDGSDGPDVVVAHVRAALGSRA